MSMLHFSRLVERAKKRLEQSTSLVEPVMISTSCSHVLFLHEHIHLLEEQLGKAQNEKHKAIDEHHRMLKINAQLCNILEDKGFSKEEIQKIVDYA